MAPKEGEQDKPKDKDKNHAKPAADKPAEAKVEKTDAAAAAAAKGGAPAADAPDVDVKEDALSKIFDAAPKQGPRRRSGGGRRGGRDGRGRKESDDENKWFENLVQVNRTAKVIKGGRRFSFSALVVSGDGMGRVGIGFGRANEVPIAVDKAKKDARKNLLSVHLSGDTIPHEVRAKFRASKVSLFPARAGDGLICGATVRAVVEAAGVRNIMSKVHGSANRINVVKATFRALEQLRTKEQVERLRGVKL